MNEFENYIDKGGIILIPLIMSAIGLTIIIYKFFELYLFRKNDLEKFDYSFKISPYLYLFKSFEGFYEVIFLNQILDILSKKNNVLNNDSNFHFVGKKRLKKKCRDSCPLWK